MLTEKDHDYIKNLTENMTIDDINRVAGLLNNQRRTYFSEISRKLDSLILEKRKILDSIDAIRRELMAEAERLKKEGDIKLSRELLLLAESAGGETAEPHTEGLVHDSPFFKDLQINDSVEFGRYPQGGDDKITSPLLWKVLDVKGNNALLITKYAVACHEYNILNGKASWKNSALNKWLNREFLSEAFTGEEQSVLIKPLAENIPGAEDRVSVLSIDEIESYMESERLRTCYGTIHALKQGAAHFVDSTNVIWWTRDIQDSSHAAVITPAGTVCRNKNVCDRFICVRPAVWVRYK